MSLPHRLTDLQIELMDVVWERGEASVGDVHEALLERTGLARQTIGTLLARLEKSGVLTRRAVGREHVYRACVTREQVQRATVQKVLDRLFGGSLPALIGHALEAREVQPGDAERVREMLRAWEREKGGTE